MLEAGHPTHKEKLLYNYILTNFVSLSCDQFARSAKIKIFKNKKKSIIWVKNQLKEDIKLKIKLYFLLIIIIIKF